MVLRCFLLILFSLFLLSCEAQPRPVQFPVRGANHVLLGMNRDAAEGKFAFSGQKKLEYRFASPVSVLSPASFEIEYSLTGAAQPVLKAGAYSWLLPTEADWKDADGAIASGLIFHYAIPIGEHFLEHFSIASADRNTVGHIHIHSVQLTGRWYGFDRLEDDFDDHVYASPFVARHTDDIWVIDPPEVWRRGGAFGVPTDFFPVLSVITGTGSKRAAGTVVEADGRRFESSFLMNRLNIPAGLIASNMQPWNLSGDAILSFHLAYAQMHPFPMPITADPGMVFAWPAEHWRDPRYEVFRWERFPSLLIFDFADYAVQDRMLKRLAFFVEKTGFRGRLAGDDEIAELHGWNAHDYRAEDLARFFHAARAQNFPLSPEERELESILLNAGIIRESGLSIQEGEGGMISISRESADYLRYRFMAHEGFHGLFFIDEDFRAFCRGRWQQFPAEAKRFLVSFFGFQQYDVADEYLLINEFMSHILQQPVSQAASYFGQNLPSRLEDGWRKAHLPEKDEASGSWPTLADTFTREAGAFSAYVGSRWGLAAGRVHLVTVRQP